MLKGRSRGCSGPVEIGLAGGGDTVEVVGKGDAVAGADLKNLVLAVAVESGPLDLGGIACAPVKYHASVVMADDKFAPRVSGWEADD